jgi:ArsR family transcriptional regulator, virulence genes transcriptional regulator
MGEAVAIGAARTARAVRKRCGARGRARTSGLAASTQLARAARGIELHAGEAAQLLKALANERRLMILCNLIEGPISVGELNRRLPLSQSSLSQHLALLRDCGIVRTERKAQTVRYSLPCGVVTRLLRMLHAEFCA